MVSSPHWLTASVDGVKVDIRNARTGKREAGFRFAGEFNLRGRPRPTQAVETGLARAFVGQKPRPSGPRYGIVILGALAVFAGLLLDAALVALGLPFGRGVGTGLSLVMLPYFIYRLPDTLGFFRQAARPYGLEDFREDLKKLQGVRLKVPLPTSWLAWINNETETPPDSLRALRFQTLRMSPWRLLLLLGRPSYYDPDDNTLAFHRNLTALPEARRLNIVAHELNHYLVHQQVLGRTAWWHRIPVLSRLFAEFEVVMAERRIWRAQRVLRRARAEGWIDFRDIQANLKRVYGEAEARYLVEQLEKRAADFRTRLSGDQAERLRTPKTYTARDVMLRSFADSIVDRGGAEPRPSLQLLREFLRRTGLTLVGLRPLFAAEAGRGSAARDYSQLQPGAGTWREIRDLARGADLMVDFEANHVSIAHPLAQGALISRHLSPNARAFEQYGAYQGFLIAFDKKNAPGAEDLRTMVRPGAAPPLMPYFVVSAQADIRGRRQTLYKAFLGVPDRKRFAVVETTDGQLELVPVLEAAGAVIPEHLAVKVRALHVAHGAQVLGTGLVYSTFSRALQPDQLAAHPVDLNYRNPNVLLEITDVLLRTLEEGVRMIRFQDIGYIWKKPGTASLHEPEAHLLLQTLTLFLAQLAPGVLTAADVREPRAQPSDYLEQNGRREVDWVAQRAGFPLAVHAVVTGNAAHYRQWLETLKPVGPRQLLQAAGTGNNLDLAALHGILPAREAERLADRLVKRHGAQPVLNAQADGTVRVSEIAPLPGTW